MQVLVFDKDGEHPTGLPTTNLKADLTGRVSDLSFTHAAMWGPLEARMTVAATIDEGYEMADRWLGCPVEIWSPDGQWCWEGFVWTVRFGTGRRRRSRSLEGYSQWGRVFYQYVPFVGLPPDEPPRTLVVGDDAYDGRYPSFSYTLSGLWPTEYAERKAEALLASRRKLLWLPESSGSLAQADDQPTVEIECLGWYRTLWYSQYYYSGPPNVLEWVIDLIKMILHDTRLGTSPYLVDDQTKIVGDNHDAVPHVFDKFEPPGEIIKRLTRQAAGPDIGTKEYVFGVLQGRIPYLHQSKRYSSDVDYLEHIDGRITDTHGSEVPLYLVRPDTILRQVDFAPASASSSLAIDAIENIYMSQTTWSSPGDLSYTSGVAGVLGEVEDA
jgi:hypothetical protein